MSGRVACWVVNYIKMQFFSFFSYLFHLISSSTLRQKKPTKIPVLVPFIILYTFSMTVFWQKISRSFPMRITPNFSHCLGFLPSVFNPTVFGFSVKVTYAACSISNKVMPSIRIYTCIWYYSLTPIFVWNPAWQASSLAAPTYWAWGSTRFGDYIACVKFLFCMISYSYQCWLLCHCIVHSCNRNHTELTNLPFPKYIFDTCLLHHYSLPSLFLGLSLVRVIILKNTGLSRGCRSTLLSNFCHNKKNLRI